MASSKTRHEYEEEANLRELRDLQETKGEMDARAEVSSLTLRTAK